MIHDPLPRHETVAVFGLGGSGIAAAKLLSVFGKKIIASDSADESKRADFEAKLPEGTTLILGHNEIGDATVIVTSPGLEPSLPIFAEAAARGIPVVAELELGFLATDKPLVAITGTDGKTTTTTLTSHLLNACGVQNLMGGNVGIPLCTSVSDEKDVDCYVVETSAFQLAFCPDFRPHILIATNIAEDHAEYFHNDWDQYVNTKRKPLNNMGPNDIVILNASDAFMSEWNQYSHAQNWWYADRKDHIPEGATHYAYLDEEEYCLFVQFGDARYSIAVDEIELRGRHNMMNVMASVLAALGMGCAWDQIVASLNTYKLPPHRIELVCECYLVRYIDDSKATNPHAAMAALETINEPLILIAGGVDKGLSLGAWIEAMKKNVRGLILIGAITERLHREALERDFPRPIFRCATIEEAVDFSYELARASHSRVVLLSPACSSYDMFKSYSERGDRFAKAARRMCGL